MAYSSLGGLGVGFWCVGSDSHWWGCLAGVGSGGLGWLGLDWIGFWGDVGKGVSGLVGSAGTCVEALYIECLRPG